jgi:hypothetical protein
MRRTALPLIATAIAIAGTFSAGAAHASGACGNEPGDINVLGIVGVDNPGTNGQYAVCVAGQPDGVSITHPFGGTCVQLIVNGQLVGSC